MNFGRFQSIVRCYSQNSTWEYKNNTSKNMGKRRYHCLFLFLIKLKIFFTLLAAEIRDLNYSASKTDQLADKQTLRMKLVRMVAPLVLALLVSLPALAQKNYKQDADNAFLSESYFSAIEMYKKAFTKEKSKGVKAEILFQIGECYRYIEDMKQSENWYKKALKAKYPEPNAYLNLAEVLQKQGKYDEALTEYNNYLKAKPGDAKGTQGAEACKKAQEWEDNPTRWEVSNEALLNSKQYDFSPAFADKKMQSLIFTSTREGSTGSDVDSRSGENFSDCYTTKRDKKGKWSVPSLLNDAVNTPHNEGSVALNRKASMMYFTRCASEKNQKLGCEIWQAKRQGQKWGDAKKIEIALPADSFTVGHPTLSADDLTLLFASDMPGGFGGKDLWYITYDKKGKTWSAPTNCGNVVNTAANEMFPYLHNDGSLYFSSDGHLGMGGLDIFKAEKSGDHTWANVENMQYPINSMANDFGIIFEGNKTRGYLTSNRQGGKGGDDIWSFYMPPLVFALQGTISDVDSKSPVPNAKVRLEGNDGSSVEVTADATGFFAFAEKDGGKTRYIAQGVEYQMYVSAPDYLNAKGEESTLGLEESTTFVHDFALQSIKKDEIRFPEVLYDLGKWDLRAESKDSLNFLYQTLIDNPTIVIELSAHTDSRGSNSSNDVLSQKRAQSCVDYLVEKGIPAARMQPVGYGEGKLIFTDPYIGGLATEEEREAAHQRNRRTVFRVTGSDFVPPAAPEGEGTGTEEGE